MLKVDTKAPDFVLPDQDGNLVKLSDLLNKSNVVLFFYPKDNTPGCSKQSCLFRDNYEGFKAYNVQVIGISKDSVESHKDFAKTLHLPFKLLSDNNGKVEKLYEVNPTLGIISGRVTFVVDKNGIIRYSISSQFNVKRHIDETLKFVQSLT